MDKSGSGKKSKKVEDAMDKVSKKVRDLESTVNVLRDKLEYMWENNEIMEKIEDAKYEAGLRKQELEDFVREHPFISVSVAVLAGITIGKLLKD